MSDPFSRRKNLFISGLGGSGGSGLKMESVSWGRVEFAFMEELMFGEKV